MNAWQTFWIGFSVLGFTAFSVQAEEAEWEIVRGSVEFQKRNTFVPFIVCADPETSIPCPQSKPYWVLRVKPESDDSALYEWEEPIAIGREEAPAGIELGSVWLQAGDRIEVEARIEPIESDWKRLAEIRSISFLDSPLPPSERLTF